MRTHWHVVYYFFFLWVKELNQDTKQKLPQGKEGLQEGVTDIKGKRPTHQLGE